MSDSGLDNKANKVVSNAQVLVVDDSGSIREIEVGLLRDLGFTNVHAVVDGDIALSYLQNHKVDFVICDWDMPHMSGIELLCKMKEEPTLSNIPFLMITATAEPKKVAEAISKGVSDYIVKPFQAKDFAYRVVKLLRKIPVS